jgi:glycosyltransferase involved in cell wall biosynthesis
VTTAPFSVLLPVYGGDVPAQVRDAFRSVTSDQELPPTEVVIVRDGPVAADLEAELSRIEATTEVAVNVVRIAENGGLARALNRGLEACSYAIVARMDADDISTPDRFAVQIPAFVDLEVDLLGAALWELGDDTAARRVRIPPLGADDIRRAARFRQPFHHPTVVYRRDAVVDAGGYRTDVGRFEDYVLFATMLMRGAKVANLAQPLVHYRIGAGAYARRGGLDHFRNEVRLQQELRRIGLISRAEAVRNLISRGSYRLVPSAVRERIYSHFASSPAR